MGCFGINNFFHSFIAFSWFHIKQQKARRKSFFLHFAQTRMKFIASNMRFHTEAFEKMPAELHIKRWQINSVTLSSKTKTYLCDWRWWYTLVLMSFIIETFINYEAKTRTALRFTTADIDTFLWLVNFDSKFAFLNYYFNKDTANLSVESVMLTNLHEVN